MLYFGLYVQLRRGSVAGYTTDESWAYRPKEGVEAFESITFFIRFIYAINFEHLLKQVFLISFVADKRKKAMRNRKEMVFSLSVAHDLKTSSRTKQDISRFVVCLALCVNTFFYCCPSAG